MDPFSAALSAYLNTVSNFVVGSYAEAQDVHLKSVNIEYQGVPISFQHQIWRIRDESVCAPLRTDMLDYAKCTQVAHELFIEICDQLSNGQRSESINPRYRSMYCNAAVSFTPTIASINAAEEDTPLEAARKECNRATAAAMGSSRPEVAWERAQACEAYHLLRDASQ